MGFHPNNFTFILDNKVAFRQQQCTLFVIEEEMDHVEHNESNRQNKQTSYRYFKTFRETGHITIDN